MTISILLINDTIQTNCSIDKSIINTYLRQTAVVKLQNNVWNMHFICLYHFIFASHNFENVDATWKKEINKIKHTLHISYWCNQLINKQ